MTLGVEGGEEWGQENASVALPEGARSPVNRSPRSFTPQSLPQEGPVSAESPGGPEVPSEAHSEPISSLF